LKQNIGGQFDRLCAGDVPQIRIKLIKYKTKMIRGKFSFILIIKFLDGVNY